MAMIPIQRNSRLDTKFGILANEGVAFANLDKRYKRVSESSRLKSREAIISSLLMISEDAEDCTENFLKEEIKYNELAMLSEKDLELLGVQSAYARGEILTTLKELQNQEITFDEIIKHSDSEMFNSHIMERVIDHLSTMSSSISATNYKLRFNPPNDTIIEEKFYASKYVMETLNELKKVTIDIDKQLKILDKLAEVKPSKKRKIVRISTVIALFGGICVGMWVWKKN